MEEHCQEGHDRSGKNGQLTSRDGKISARPLTPHRETAAKDLISKVIHVARSY